MIEWVRQNVDVLNALTSLATVVIWLAYLQLFYQSFRRQRRPKLLIHEAGGLDLGDRCIITNMSSTAVHVAAVLVDVERDGEQWTFQPKSPKPSNTTDGESKVLDRQGPLQSGSYIDVGSFEALLTAAQELQSEQTLDAPTRITVRVVGFIGAELFPAAAKRTFEVIDNEADGMLVHPLSVMPTELDERQQRRVARDWLREVQRLDLARIETPLHAHTEASGAS
jgi:hypothetical protein